jgi:PucR C-terminal helix-turn-helix domain
VTQGSTGLEAGLGAQAAGPPVGLPVGVHIGLRTGAQGQRDAEHEAALLRLLPVLAQRLPALFDDVEEVLRGSWPEYADFLTSERSEVVSAAEGQLPALLTTARRLSQEEPEADDVRATEVVFEEIGAAQCRCGQELTSLIAAYQAGAGAAWRHVAAAALDVGVSHRVLTVLAESVFVFVDHLSSASTRGYLREQAEASVSRERLREELAELLLSERTSTALLRVRAQQAGWPLPREAAVVVLGTDGARAGTAPVRLDPSWLPLRRSGVLGAIVPDPSARGQRERLVRQLAGAGAVVGRTVPLEELPSTLPGLEVAQRLRREGVLTAEPVFVQEHLDTVLVHRDERLLADLRAEVLAPLDGLPPATRERLEETLEVWLRHSGARAAVAEELHVHPQTVRYRIDQLRKAFGAGLDDPRSRMRLLLALGWGGDLRGPAPA